jgi:2-polyprenyl-6-methoxyphenol hydroxylase-like FAD-dependent oxidoreductase
MGYKNFSIVGGGIAGLACALGVARSGGEAQIFEKARVFEHVGAGLQLGPNALRALQKLGAWDAVSPITSSPPEIHIRSGVTGRILSRIKLGKNFEQKFGAPYRVAHRADLHSALLQVVQDNPKISLEMESVVEAPALAGQGPVLAADGIWSQTRATLFPQSKVVALNDKIFRSLNSMPIASGKVALDCVNLWMFPGGHVVHYPVGKPQQLNLVAVTQGQNPIEHFKTAAFDLQLLLANVDDWMEWPAAHVAGLDHWSRQDVLLVGDAAHGTVPYLAQGAAMALEDAECLSDLLTQTKDISSVFEKFTQNRIQRCEKLGAESLKAGRIYHVGRPVSVARDLTLAVLPPSRIIERQSWIYNYKQQPG